MTWMSPRSMKGCSTFSGSPTRWGSDVDYGQADQGQAKVDAAKEEARLARRREYDKAGRERRKLKALAASGLDDLPSDVAVAIEESLAAPAATPEPPGARRCN